ncbi:glycosyltransferase family 4 protein [Paenibacillus tarimensis]
MRVALFTDTFDPEINGVARTLGRWIDYLKKRGIPCVVFAPAPSAASELSSASSNTVERFASLPLFLYPECRLALPNPLYIRRTLEAFRPTLIHVATPFNMGVCGIRYAKKYDIPLIASYHTHFDQYLRFYNLQWMSKMLWRYMNWFHQDCRAIFVPSQSTLRDLEGRGWAADRLAVWGRGMDTRLFHPYVNREEWLTENGIGKDRFVVLYVGRLAPEKHVDIALEAFGIFQREICPNALFIVAGDGPSAELLKQQAEQGGIDARFIGFTKLPQLQQWYAASDVFLFPSATETFGNVVLEAMSCGTAVIVADKGGVTDTVEHGVTGLRCPAGETQAFAKALKTLYKDNRLRERLAAWGRAYSQRQSWDHIFSRFLSACERIGANPAHSTILRIGK